MRIRVYESICLCGSWWPVGKISTRCVQCGRKYPKLAEESVAGRARQRLQGEL